MQPSLFDYARRAPAPANSNDYHLIPASTKQLDYARLIASQQNAELPADVQGDRSRLSAWIDAHKHRAASGQFSNYPSSKQVAFAERIARMKRRQVPPECFHDRTRMSKWIDSNL